MLIWQDIIALRMDRQCLYTPVDSKNPVKKFDGKPLLS